MALRSGDITRASLITLPAHISLAVGLSLAWLVQPSPQTSASLAALQNFWPLQNTAVVLMVVGLSLLACWVRGSRALTAICLSAAALVYMGLAYVTVDNHVDGSSWGSTVIFCVVAAYHLASVVSLVFNDQRGTGAA